MEILLAAARAADLSAGGFGDRFRRDDEEFPRGKPVRLGDERDELLAETRVILAGILSLAELHHHHEVLLLGSRHLGLRRRKRGNGEGGDGALLDLGQRVAGVFDVLRVVVLAVDDDQVFGAAAEVELVIVWLRNGRANARQQSRAVQSSAKQCST